MSTPTLSSYFRIPSGLCKFLQPGLLALPLALQSPWALGEDPRLVWSGGDPLWLGAVGRLQVPSQRHEGGGTRHYREDCSATLVAQPTSPVASIIVSAWHCLEDYSDFSREIHFTLAGEDAAAAPLIAYPVESGGNMESDWAILKLDRGVPRHRAIALGALEVPAQTSQRVTMAGYSRDSGRGANGAHLTYDSRCRISGRVGKLLATDCTAFKGASGGAVVQYTETGEARFAGVISAGNSEGVSHFVPLARFRRQLERALP